MYMATKNIPVGKIEKGIPENKIDKGIPLPKYTKMVKDTLVSDLKIMEPGDSRIIEVDYDPKTLNAVRTRVHSIKEKTAELQSRQFTVNIDPVGGKKLRVWRVI